MKLNKEQYRAAHHIGGPMLVLAGPGSGKTHVLVERIRIMIEEADIRPENILVITFSRKSAREMQARFIQRVKGRSYPVTFGTFHAVFYNILKDHDPDTSNLISEDQKHNLIEQAIHKSGAYSFQAMSDDDIEIVAGLVSALRNLGDDFYKGGYAGEYMNEDMKKELNALCDMYGTLCQQEGVLDFDDMILRCRVLLYKHEGVLRKWRERYRYILVDEFQDINDGQYDVLRLLAGDEKNVFAVGDDDQSIYAFRGARPQLMKKFLRQYNGCCRVPLTMNYRCSAKIIGAADTVIRNNTERIERPMQRHLPSKAGGEVMIVNSENTEVQAEFVCDRIQELMERYGYAPEDFAVLYRSDHCAGLFRQVAGRRGFELRTLSKGYVPKRQKIHEAYVRAKTGNASRADWFLIMNNPERGLSREALCNADGNYIEAFRHYYKNDPDKLAKIYELERSVMEYDAAYIPETCRTHNAINVMTAHASKGLEFKCVFIIGLQEGLFPHHKSMSCNIEEERRLMYVAMTRAKERLYMCTVSTEHGKRASRFAGEALGRMEYISDVLMLTKN